GELVQLDEFAHHLVLAAALDAIDYARVEVVVEHQPLHLPDGAPYGISLLEHVDKVLVLLNHAPDALQMAFDEGRPFEDIDALIFVHIGLPQFVSAFFEFRLVIPIPRRWVSGSLTLSSRSQLASTLAAIE